MSNSALWEKEEVIEAIILQHKKFKETITALDQKTFDFSWEGKWTPGQQLEHIKKSVAPVVLAFRLPRFMLKYQFGVTNRPSRSYDALVARYLKALDGKTAVAPKQFQPPLVPFKTRQKHFKAYEKVVQKFVKLAQKCPEKDLDYYVLPHPLIGKLTLREILFFCLYHVQHHHQITKEIIRNSSTN
ncbi:MAG: DinB family protein [Flavobacteriaceae bacterium]